MKKFLGKLLVFGLLISIIIGVINGLYKSKVHEKTIENVPEHIQFCNFGNSQPMNDIDYATLDTEKVCFNFALSAQSFSYDYRILQNFKDNIEPGAKVLISVSYHALFGVPETEGADFESKNRRYYLFLPKELIKNYDFETYILVRYFPSLTAGITLIPSILGVYDSVDTIVRTNREEAERTAQARYENLFGAVRDKAGNIQLDEEDIGCVYDMISLCREIGAEPVLFTPPYLAEYTDVIEKNDPEILPEFYRIVAEISESTGTPYIDWSQDERFAERYEWFTNLDHMNKDGAAQYTKVLLQELSELK